MLAEAITIRIGLLSLLLAAPSVPWAASLTLQVVSADGPVADAVISLNAAESALSEPHSDRISVDQVGSEFVPRVTVVRVGTAVDFPNSDLTRHQVYSFSPAKRFSLPLYSGTPPAPVLFDQAGVVSLGCNIHDWMQGFIVVVNTPYFGKTDAEGRASLSAPAGSYRVQLWHERLLGDPSQTMELVDGPSDEIRLEIELSAPPPPRGSDRLRALQNKLREQGGKN